MSNSRRPPCLHAMNPDPTPTSPIGPRAHTRPPVDHRRLNTGNTALVRVDHPVGTTDRHPTRSFEGTQGLDLLPSLMAWHKPMVMAVQHQGSGTFW